MVGRREIDERDEVSAARAAVEPSSAQPSKSPERRRRRVEEAMPGMVPRDGGLDKQQPSKQVSVGLLRREASAFASRRRPEEQER